ncbi:universal stress protein [Pseudonocardia spirodelae]|uniref:Universal stress protein n=1 Tax=Pseudonocardia spirodelae TaxID=3133431 RepID=A0ABU8T2J7_9PSEU
MNAAGAADGDVIVVGIDGSISGRAALRWAAGEAARGGRRVRAVRVWDPAPLFAPPAPVFEVRATVRAEEQAGLEDDLVATPLTEGVTVEGELLEGDVVDTLVAVSRDAAMLVVGSHGRHRVLGRVVLGSVSTACTRRAACPVVVVTPPLVTRLIAETGGRAARRTP